MDTLDYSTAIQDIDTRLKVANFFRFVLDSEILDSQEEEAILVKERIRSFIGDELSYLMGVKKQESAMPVVQQVVSLSLEELENMKQLISLLTATLAKKNTNKAEQQEMTQEIAEPEPIPETKKPSKKAKKSEKDLKKEEIENFKHLIPKKYLDDPSLFVKNGRVMVQLKDNDGNFRYKEDASGNTVPIYRDVTLTTAPTTAPKPLPMPNPRYYEVMAANAPPAGEGLVNGVNAALRSGSSQRTFGQQQEHFSGSPDFVAD